MKKLTAFAFIISLSFSFVTSAHAAGSAGWCPRGGGLCARVTDTGGTGGGAVPAPRQRLSPFTYQKIWQRQFASPGNVPAPGCGITCIDDPIDFGVFPIASTDGTGRLPVNIGANCASQALPAAGETVTEEALWVVNRDDGTHVLRPGSTDSNDWYAVAWCWNSGGGGPAPTAPPSTENLFQDELAAIGPPTLTVDPTTRRQLVGQPVTMGLNSPNPLQTPTADDGICSAFAQANVVQYQWILDYNTNEMVTSTDNNHEIPGYTSGGDHFVQGVAVYDGTYDITCRGGANDTGTLGPHGIASPVIPFTITEVRSLLQS